MKLFCDNLERLDMKTAYIIDSTASLPEAYQDHPDVYQVYLSIHYANGNSLRDTTDPEALQRFYEDLPKEEEIPTTSQPQPQQFYDIMDDLVAEGYEAVYGFFLSADLSGTYQTAYSVMHEYDDRLRVHVIDSKSISLAIEALLDHTIRLQEAGASEAEILDHLEKMVDQTALLCCFEDLSYLVKGGRAGNASALIGKILNIFPVLEVHSKVEVFAKVRSRKRVYATIVDEIEKRIQDYPDGVERLIVLDALNPEGVAALEQAFTAAYPHIKVEKTYLTPVIGIHAGRDAYGVIAVPNLPRRYQAN